MRKGVKYLLSFLLALGLCACTRPDSVPSESPPRIVLGFSQLGDESEFRTSSSNDVKRAAEDAGIQLVFDNAQQKQFNQIKAIRSFIISGVDAIAFCPVVEEGWDNVLSEAKAAGIPVILVDRMIKTEAEGLYSAFIGSDFHRQGVDAARWMTERFAGHEGVVKVAEITGNDNASPTIGRYEGLREVFAENPGFDVVTSISGDFMRSKGYECMEAILEQFPDIDILYAHNDDMALGAIELMEEHGAAPGEDIAIVSIDAQKSGLEALSQGKINCIIECNPYVGDELMALVSDIVNGREFNAHTYVEERMFTDEDDAGLLPERP
jgi:ABC-type sugar transport system substrate-binding protein